MAKVCPNCKTVNVDNASFCQKCGNDLKQTSKEPQRVQSPKSKGSVRPKEKYGKEYSIRWNRIIVFINADMGRRIYICKSWIPK